MQISIVLNGKKIQEEIEPDLLLIDFVRKHGCKSVKRGCETSGCGLCTVFLDDKPVLSCSILAARVDGHKVTTLEGLKEEAEEFGAFIADQGAEQCGFCNPGMIMNALALFRENEFPNEEEIKEYLAGNVSLAGAFTIILLASEFFIPLRLLGSFFHIAMNGMSASDKIFKILDMEEPKRGEHEIEGEQMDVTLQHVEFSYEPERKVLRDISLTIPSGKFVSLVGLSGCGKSTIAALLTGKNRTFSGQIQINNVPIQEIKESSLMDKITLVRHNSYLFKGTVEENLKMADPSVSREQMEAALRQVNLYEFLQAQNGLNTMLEEQGSNFSGGQRQRLAIARALLHDTPMYIFDEAASNIDVESEDQIMEVIRELAKTKTILFISHRLANVVASDQIYMLENGQITESGTHGELMKKAGSYANMYQKQQELCQVREGRA